MKIAFSTLGCPEFGWTDIYSMAKDFHFDGIEVRGLGHDLYAYRAAPFAPGLLAARGFLWSFPEIALGQGGN